MGFPKNDMPDEKICHVYIIQRRRKHTDLGMLIDMMEVVVKENGRHVRSGLKPQGTVPNSAYSSRPVPYQELIPGVLASCVV